MIHTIINTLKNPTQEDKDLILKAFAFAKEMHEGQERFSGEAYITHPFETAKTLAEFQLDSKAIAAGLLHDVCEDCLIVGEKAEANNKIIKKKFGDEISFLVDGVTKLGTLKYRGEEWKTENLRKMFLAMAQDIRVILIKLADRLHNMRTLKYVPNDKQKRIALETLEIYAPIANRLGMGKIKGELEDLAFSFLYPEEYKNVKNLINEKRGKQGKQLLKIKHKVIEALTKDGIKIIQIDSRVKHLYSTYKKLKQSRKDMSINLVHDLIAMRIVVKNIENCYKTLGIIHKLWTPMPRRLKDYIAVPKPNGYQSLHTVVFIDEGKQIEIQIRTKKMHDEAEQGIAAHWAYDEMGKPKNGGFLHPKLAWINQLVKWQEEISGSQDFLEALKIDFFEDRVFCFTPKGDAIDLPKDAAVIDFAYAVHTEVGNQATGAIVNGKFMSLDSPLKNCDVVEIQIQKNKKPNIAWLKFAKTSLARRQIKTAGKSQSFLNRFGL